MGAESFSATIMVRIASSMIEVSVMAAPIRSSR